VRDIGQRTCASRPGLSIVLKAGGRRVWRDPALKLRAEVRDPKGEAPSSAQKTALLQFEILTVHNSGPSPAFLPIYVERFRTGVRCFLTFSRPSLSALKGLSAAVARLPSLD
jgi:hypothetical protein